MLYVFVAVRRITRLLLSSVTKGISPFNNVSILGMSCLKLCQCCRKQTNFRFLSPLKDPDRLKNEFEELFGRFFYIKDDGTEQNLLCCHKRGKCGTNECVRKISCSLETHRFTYDSGYLNHRLVFNTSCL